jgi:AraC family ethanolamine operon transcriptional activator
MLVRKGNFQDWDQWCEAVFGWDLSHWMPIDKKHFAGNLLQIQTDSFFIARAGMNRGFSQCGTAPPGYRVFGMVVEDSNHTIWCGSELTGRLARFQKDGTYEAVSSAGFSPIALGISESVLASTVSDEKCDLVLDERRSVLDCNSLALMKAQVILSSFAEQLSNTAVNQQSELCIAREIVEQIESAISGTDSTNAYMRPKTATRRKALQRGRDFIEANIREPLTISEICKAIGVCDRTLEYAFKEYFGVSPKFYLNARRLHLLRSELQSATGDTQVIDFANDLGFWHMGKLAADYRKLFGELPSSTLRTADSRC